MPSDAPAPWRVVLFTEFPMVASWYKAFFAERGHRLVAVVTTSKRSQGYIDVVRAVQPEVDALVSNHPKRWAAQLAPLHPDLIVTTVFPWRLSADLLALPRLGAVNVHPALLPRFRGTDTPAWVLRHGEREWGMTLHRMAVEFDAGPILAQESIPIEDDDTLDTLMPKLFGTMPALWASALLRIAGRDPGDPQDEAAMTYFGAIPDREAWRRIDWSQPARTVHNIVRSCHWPPGAPMWATADIAGEPHIIRRTRLVEAPGADAAPGTVLARDGETLTIRCGDGAIQLLDYRPA